MSLQNFVKHGFSTTTLSNQIEQQEELIREAQQRIERLKKQKDNHESKPWYQWEGISFEQNAYEHFNSYRDRTLGSRETEDYMEFVGWILGEIVDSLSRLGYGGDSDFFLYNPVGSRYKFTWDELKQLPLVKEYLEREEIMKTHKKALKQMADMREDLEDISIEIKNTDKYAPTYIEQMKKQHAELTDKLAAFEKENSEAVYQKRLQELIDILRELDEDLEDRSC